MHHNHRGLPKRRYKVWTVLHNFDGRAADGTTPASRFFRRPFPELFETVLSHLEVLDLGNENTMGYSVADVIKCPALHGYPVLAIPARRDTLWRQ